MTAKEEYERLQESIKQCDAKAKKCLSMGDSALAEVYSAEARLMKRRAEQLERSYGIRPGSDPTPTAHRKDPTPAAHRKDQRPSKPGVQDIISGVFKGMEKVTGKNYALEALQHVTSEKECQQLLMTVKNMFTDSDGNLDKKGYCSALQDVLDSMSCTINELEKAIDDAKRDGNTGMIPGLETAIKQYRANAAIIKKEINKYK